jgi:hypothetical protein
VTQQRSESTTNESTTKATSDAVFFGDSLTAHLVRDYDARGRAETGAKRAANRGTATPLAWLSELALHLLELCASADGGSQEGGANHCGYAFQHP